MRHIRNASFLVFLAVSLFTVKVHAFTCEQESQICELGSFGILCGIEAFCSGGQWHMNVSCLGSVDGAPPTCWNIHSPVLYNTTCSMGGSC